MVSTTFPTSGARKLSDVKLAFPNVTNGNSMSSYRGKHPSLPASGAISLSSFNGLTAVSPTHALASKTWTSINMSGAGAITGTVGGSLTVDFSTYLQNASYNGSVTYAITAGSLPAGVTLASNGTLTVGTSASTAGSTTNVTVMATNSFGNQGTIAVSFNINSAGASAFPPRLATGTYNGTTGSYTSTVSGQSYGNGTYVITRSGAFSSQFEAYMAFDNTTNFWASSQSFDTGGAFTGTATTTAGGKNYVGEWATIQMPASITLTNYQLTPASANAFQSTPKTWALLGSTDGSTWAVIHEQSSAYNWVNTNQITTNVSPPSAYAYYRIVIMTNGGWSWSGFENIVFNGS